MEIEKVCRTCLQIFDVNAVTHLNHTEDDLDRISIRQKLQACVPELTLDIVHDPVICKTCCAAIILAYQFKSSCLENEETLYNFIKQRTHNPYDLLTTSDLLKIVRKGISEEHSYSFIEKCYVNGHVSDSESDSESIELKLPKTIQTSLEDLVKLALADNSCRNIVDTEDMQETSKATTKAKQIKQSVENGGSNEDVMKSPVNSPKTLKILNETASTNIKHSKKNLEPASSSVNSDSNQAVGTSRNPSKKQEKFSLPQSVENVMNIINSGLPTAPEITENCCRTRKNKERNKQRKQSSPKKNIFDGKNSTGPKESAKSLSQNTEPKENIEASMKMDSEQNTAKKRSLKHDEVTTCPPKKCFKKEVDRKTASKKMSKQIERQNDCKVNGIEILPSPSSIKTSLSERDLRSTNDNTIENDLLEINQMILKNDLSVEKVSSYRRDNRRYRCTKCSSTYNFKSHFDVHLKSHIFKKLYTCPICAKDFTQEKYLTSHALLHTSSGLYQCDICLKYLSSSTALKRHHRTHTGEKPYPCAICNKSFSQNIQLTVHMRTHTGFKPFNCNVCKAAFTQKSHLMGHVRIHTGEKPYKCDQCPKSFRKSYALQIHKHSHSVKPFQCRMCNFLFKEADTFQRHVNKHLECIANTGSHVLKKAKSRYKILDELEQDVKDINMATRLKEQLDGDGSQTNSPFLYHCNICTRGFRTKFSVKRHMKLHVKDSTETLLL